MPLITKILDPHRFNSASLASRMFDLSVWASMTYEHRQAFVDGVQQALNRLVAERVLEEGEAE